MAYIKYKELAQYFNFNKELDLNALPDFVKQFITVDETPLIAYATVKDKFILTNKKIILFDVRGFISYDTKRIHVFPFNSISSTAIEFGANKVSIFLSLDSGYQVRLNFIKMSSQNKTRLREVYMTLVNYITNAK